MTFFDSHRVFARVMMACLIATSGTAVPVFAANAPSAEEPEVKEKDQAGTRTALTVEGISVQGDDDYPRVLNILPWQPPTVSRRAHDPLRLEGEGLLEPVDPEAMQRHRQFRKTLDPLGTAGPDR